MIQPVARDRQELGLTGDEQHLSIERDHDAALFFFDLSDLGQAGHRRCGALLRLDASLFLGVELRLALLNLRLLRGYFAAGVRQVIPGCGERFLRIDGLALSAPPQRVLLVAVGLFGFGLIATIFLVAAVDAGVLGLALRHVRQALLLKGARRVGVGGFSPIQGLFCAQELVRRIGGSVRLPRFVVGAPRVDQLGRGPD